MLPSHDLRPSICLCLQEASPDLLCCTELVVRRSNIFPHPDGHPGPWEPMGILDPKTQEDLDALPWHPEAQPWV